MQFDVAPRLSRWARCRKSNAYFMPPTHDPSSLARGTTSVHTYRHLGIFLGRPPTLGRTCVATYNSFTRPPLPCDSYIMADDQISLPYLLAILVVSGLIIRYLFFGGPSPPQPIRSPEAFLRSREIAVERIQQMFPQADRRSILWDLQRNGGNIQSTTERILAGRLDTVC